MLMTYLLNWHISSMRVKARGRFYLVSLHKPAWGLAHVLNWYQLHQN